MSTSNLSTQDDEWPRPVRVTYLEACIASEALLGFVRWLEERGGAERGGVASVECRDLAARFRKAARSDEIPFFAPMEDVPVPVAEAEAVHEMTAPLEGSRAAELEAELKLAGARPQLYPIFVIERGGYHKRPDEKVRHHWLSIGAGTKYDVEMSLPAQPWRRENETIEFIEYGSEGPYWRVQFDITFRNG